MRERREKRAVNEGKVQDRRSGIVCKRETYI